MSYKCGECGKEYETVQKLTDHLILHSVHDQGIFKCNDCDKIFTKENYLDNHRIAYHTAELVAFKCEICENEYLDENELIEHKILHINEKADNEADKNNIYLEELSTEQISEFNVIDDGIVIKIETPTSSSALENLEESSDKNIIFFEEAYFEGDSSEIQTKVEPIEDCSKDFEESNPLSVDSNDVLLNPYLETNDPLSNKSLDDLEIKSETEAETSTFFLQEDASLQEASDENGFEDTKEDTEFVDKNKLLSKPTSKPKSKRRKKNATYKPVKCKICGKSFSFMSNLRSHEIVHTDYKPYKCVYCGKGFSRRSGLNRHSKIHTGERPFSCDICGKSFIEAYKLKLHKISDSCKNKIYKCNSCSKTFERFEYLKKHQETFSHIQTIYNQSLVTETITSRQDDDINNIVKNEHQYEDNEQKFEIISTTIDEEDEDGEVLFENPSSSSAQNFEDLSDNNILYLIDQECLNDTDFNNIESEIEFSNEFIG